MNQFPPDWVVALPRSSRMVLHIAVAVVAVGAAIHAGTTHVGGALAAALPAPGPGALPGSAPDLLEAERAFALSARGLDPSTVEVTFAVAPGYYLYRDKLRFAVEPVAIARAPALPQGEVKEDAFFGRTQTYRGDVVVRVPLAAAAPGAKVTVIADSQGCADVGVCYPAQRQRLAVQLPRAGAGPGPVADAAVPKRGLFR